MRTNEKLYFLAFAENFMGILLVCAVSFDERILPYVQAV